MKVFFLKVSAKNMDAHYTWQKYGLTTRQAGKSDITVPPTRVWGGPASLWMAVFSLGSPWGGPFDKDTTPFTPTSQHHHLVL